MHPKHSGDYPDTLLKTSLVLGGQFQRVSRDSLELSGYIWLTTVQRLSGAIYGYLDIGDSLDNSIIIQSSPDSIQIFGPLSECYLPAGE